MGIGCFVNMAKVGEPTEAKETRSYRLRNGERSQTVNRNRECDPGICDHCLYIGDGDFICDLHGMGPEETVFVLEDWMRTEHYLQCKNEGRNT